jgi:hypothetical protein
LQPCREPVGIRQGHDDFRLGDDCYLGMPHVVAAVATDK